MTAKRFLFMTSEGFPEQQAWTDEAAFQLLTLTPAVAGNVVLDVASGKIANLPNVTGGAAGTDAVNKNYVDSVAQGLQIKDVCEAASTSALTSPPTGVPVVDDVYLYDGDRVLLTAQASGIENGIWVAHGVHASKDLATVSTNIDTVIEARLGGTGGNTLKIATVADGTGVGNMTYAGAYPNTVFTFHYETTVTTVANFESALAAIPVADRHIIRKTAGTGTNALVSPADTFASTFLANGASSVMTRPTDFAAGMHAHGAFTLIIEGASWRGSGWVCTNLAAGPDTIGTHALTWTQFSAVQNVTASHGIILSGSDIQAVPGDGIRLTPTTLDHIEVALTAASGLQFTGASPNGTLGAKVNTGAGLDMDGSGIKIVLEGTNPSLEFGTGGDSGKLGAQVQAAGGVKKTSTGLAIYQNTTDLGLQIDSNGVKVVGAPVLQTKMTASGQILSKHCAYISADNKISTAASGADATSRVIGVVPVTIPDTDAGVIVFHGPCTAFSGTGVANTPYYLGESGELIVAGSVGAAKRMMCVGYGLNTNELFVDIKDYGKKAA